MISQTDPQMDLQTNSQIENKNKNKSNKIKEEECIRPDNNNINNINVKILNMCCPKVRDLLTWYQPEQRTKEWFDFRRNMITASQWGAITGDNPYSSFKQTLIEKCTPRKFITNRAMTWGTKYEQVATDFYEKLKTTHVIEFGCLQHPKYPFLGASPDGITPAGIMLEIKCPLSRKITGIVPRYYWAQIQGQLEVCDLEQCDFLECKIVEYEDEEEYQNDTEEENRGTVLTFIDTEDDNRAIYKYSPFHISGGDLDNWENGVFAEMEKNQRYEFSEQTYWKLDHYSCVMVERDREWFKTALVQLTDFWNKVVYYREHGIDKLTEKEKKMKDVVESRKGILDKHIDFLMNSYCERNGISIPNNNGNSILLDDENMENNDNRNEPCLFF